MSGRSLWLGKRRSFLAPERSLRGRISRGFGVEASVEEAAVEAALKDERVRVALARRDNDIIQHNGRVRRRHRSRSAAKRKRRIVNKGGHTLLPSAAAR